MVMAVAAGGIDIITETNSFVMGSAKTLKLSARTLKDFSQNIVWSSSDFSVATVSNGVVTATQSVSTPQLIRIYAKAADGTPEATNYK